MSTTPIAVNAAELKKLLKSMSPEDMKRMVADPAKLAEMNALLRTPEGIAAAAEIMQENLEPPAEGDPTEVVVDPAVAQAEETRRAAEAAAQAEASRKAAEVAAAVKAEADRKAEIEKTEAEALRAAGITVYKDNAGNIVKLVQEYQADDEHGNPLGRPTHLEARSWVELVRKQKEAHTQATRAFHRLKAQKTSFKQQQQQIGPELLTDEQRVQFALDLKGDDPVKVAAADRALRADDVLREQARLALANENARQKQVVYEWMTKHITDFNPCVANSKIITEYLEGNNLDWTVDNLELAFAATESQLAPREVPVVEVPAPEPANIPPAPTAQVTEPVAPAPAAIPPAPAPAEPAAPTAPVAPAPAAPAAPPAVNPAPAPRPGVNGGLIPGSTSGARPIAKPTGLTMKEIWGWSGEEMRKQRANPARRAEIDRVINAYNKARASRV